MRLLLDTQAFLWFAAGDSRLSHPARESLLDESNEVYLSVVVPWELVIKHARGRMPELTEGPEAYVLSRVVLSGMRMLPIDLPHTLKVSHLPPIHRDPFDRMLVAQAQVERLSIVTSDANISRYDVETIW